ncbi:MAG TPA: glycosyltransferase [Gemmatimonadaceae bacterium]|nr:glycosyltransferase [Gemmatimonadaceae bacterium]
MTVVAPAVADMIFLPDAQLRTSRLDLSHLPLPPPLRPGARRSVLDITEFYGETTGGIRTYLREKATYVAAREPLRQVLVLPGPRDALSQANGVRCYRLEGPRVPTQDPYRFMLATRTNRRIALHERPDVIEVGSPGFVPWIVRLAARGLDIPAVAFYHSNFPRIFSPFPERAGGVRRALYDLGWRYARLIDRHFAHTIVCSEFVAGDLRAAGIDRITRIPLGVDLVRYHPSRRARRREVRAAFGLPEGPLAAFVGRFGHEKELDVLLGAWPEVHRRTGAQLALVGDGPMRARLVSQADGAPWVRFLPYERDRDQLADFLAAIDLFVAPSSNETFGLAPLEALASGTPVLSADRGGIAEQVVASGAGARFASGEAGSLAEEAIALLRSDLAALGVKGRAYAEQDHSWESVFDRIFALYDSVVDR